jgi:hypothetical protein
LQTPGIVSVQSCPRAARRIGVIFGRVGLRNLVTFGNRDSSDWRFAFASKPVDFVASLPTRFIGVRRCRGLPCLSCVERFNGSRLSLK